MGEHARRSGQRLLIIGLVGVLAATAIALAIRSTTSDCRDPVRRAAAMTSVLSFLTEYQRELIGLGEGVGSMRDWMESSIQSQHPRGYRVHASDVTVVDACATFVVTHTVRADGTIYGTVMSQVDGGLTQGVVDGWAVDELRSEESLGGVVALESVVVSWSLVEE